MRPLLGFVAVAVVAVVLAVSERIAELADVLEGI